MKKIKLMNGYYVLSPILVLFLIANISYFPHLYSDMTIDAPSIVNVGDSFIISGTSRMAAAERVNLYSLDRDEPISYAIVGIKPPFVYEFEVYVLNNNLTINGIVFESGPTAGRTFHIYVESNNQRLISSPIASITIKS